MSVPIPARLIKNSPAPNYEYGFVHGGTLDLRHIVVESRNHGDAGATITVILRGSRGQNDDVYTSRFSLPENLGRALADAITTCQRTGIPNIRIQA